MAREDDVIAGLRLLKMSATAAAVTRAINLAMGRCEWCPVLPAKPGEQCAQVPPTSHERVNRVLKRLLKAGIIVDTKMWRRPTYILKDKNAR